MEKMVISTKDLIELLSQKNGKTKKENETSIKEIVELISRLIEKNCEIRIHGLGDIRFKKVNARREREGIVNPKTLERGILPAKESYSKLNFVFAKSLREMIEDKTLGDPYEK